MNDANNLKKEIDVIDVSESADSDELVSHHEIVMRDRVTGTPVIIDIDKVEAMSARGMSLRQICDFYGISSNEFNTYKRKYQLLDYSVNKGQAKGIAMATNTLMELIRDKNLIATLFYLKARANWREADNAVVGVDGNCTVNIYLPDNNR